MIQTPRRRASATIATAMAAALAIAALTPSTAIAGRNRPPTLSPPIADGLAGPLQFAVGQHRDLVVGQSFAGALTSLGRAGRVDVATNPAGEISGVSIAGRSVYYTTTSVDEATSTATEASLRVVRNGVAAPVADLLAYEAGHDPDAGQQYGFVGITEECAAQMPPEIGPATRGGIVDSHPYATVADERGTVYVADAAANDLLAVDRHGRVRTIAVFPPEPVVVTADVAVSSGLPDCSIGLTYWFEPVPTDVEIGPDGRLYVTTLTGAAEQAFVPPSGAVWKIDSRSGSMRKVAGGLVGATNLALNDRGTIFVAELFAGRVSKIERGVVTPLIELPDPAAVEFVKGRLYVAYDVFANGAIATID